MGLLDGSGIMKLPERFLSKGPQNGIQGLKLTRIIVLGRTLNTIYKSPAMEYMFGECENGQLKVEGIGRKQYHAGMSVFEQPVNKFDDKNKK